VESLRGSVTSFFNDNCPLVFKVSIADVSLIEFVNPESSRSKLKEAEGLLAKGGILLSLDKIAMAFAEMIHDYETRKEDGLYGSAFFFGPEVRIHSILALSRQELSGSPFSGLFDRVAQSIESLQSAIKILAMGIDYRKYSKFRGLTPEVLLGVSGGPPFIAKRFSEENKPSVAQAKFCIEFVVESALTLAEFDYTWAREHG
jgi:hypothetical protein